MGDASDRVREALVKLRTLRGVPQEEVAERLGLGYKGSVSRKESGATGIDLDQLERWVEVLGGQIEILIYEAGDAEKVMLVTLTEGLGPDDIGIVRELAATLPLMPDPAKRSLRAQLKEWRASK